MNDMAGLRRIDHAQIVAAAAANRPVVSCEAQQRIKKLALYIFATLIYGFSLLLMGAGLVGAAPPWTILLSLGGFKLGSLISDFADNMDMTPRQRIDPSQVAHAPLIVIRTPGPCDANISLLFHKHKFSPRQPIVPAPSEKVEGRDLLQYTWKVHANGDGILNVDGADKKVKMIWWESIRHREPSQPLDGKPACVEKEGIKQFLTDLLVKKGLRASEYEAFVDFWDRKLNTSQSQSHFLVRLIPSDRVEDYIPKMQVESGGAEMSCQRHYFQFTPVNGVEERAPSYLEEMAPANPGDRVIFDLGGEVVGNLQEPEEQAAQFNRHFINQYIYAN